ncbi:hypothetical protein [Vibrio sp. E150_018]
MKKTVLTLTTIASLAFSNLALSATGTGDMGTASFQWSGTVPAPSTSEAGYWLVSFDGQSLLSNVNTSNGVMSLENKAGLINLVDSSVFNFKVVKDKELSDGSFDPSIDNEGVEYNVSLANLKSGTGGLVSDGDQNGYFTVTANGDVISNTTSKKYSSGMPASIKLGKASDKVSLEGADSNQTWQVMAQVAVSTQSL